MNIDEKLPRNNNIIMINIFCQYLLRVAARRLNIVNINQSIPAALILNNSEQHYKKHPQ